MASIIKHEGTVCGVREGVVKVTITVNSACHQCQAHGHCGFAESKEKTMEVETPLWERYHEGDTVTVSVSEGLGLRAALLAYLAPAALLLLVLLTMLRIATEPIAVLVTLAALALYYLVLYLCRGRLQKKFSIGIE